MTIDRSVKLERTQAFNIKYIFDGGMIEEVHRRLDTEYKKLSIFADEGKFVTFGIDKTTEEIFVKIWRRETDAEYEARIETIGLLDEVSIRKHKYQ